MTGKVVYEQRIVCDNADWAEVMEKAFDELMAYACEVCSGDELASLVRHIDGGRCRMEDSGDWGYPFRCPHTGESYDYEGDTARFCPRCGKEIEA